MLMLVVVIIVAGVVSSFATGLTGDTITSSNARVELVGVSSGGWPNGGQPQYTYGQIGVVFKNAGGDTLDLRNLKFYMTGIGFGSQGAFTLTYNDPVSLVYVEDSGYQSAAGRWRVTLPKEANGYRMQKFGDGLSQEELNNPIVEPGERFIIYCEYYDSGKVLGFRVDRGNNPDDTWSSGAINIDGGSKYTLSDVNTGVVYSSGYLEAEHIF